MSTAAFPFGGTPQSQIQCERNNWYANGRNLAISMRASSRLLKTKQMVTERGVISTKLSNTQSKPGGSIDLSLSSKYVESDNQLNQVQGCEMNWKSLEEKLTFCILSYQYNVMPTDNPIVIRLLNEIK
jgi:hypothetical protein